ncbi:hypothetical protein MUK70_10935 [Dyadobacter chenwenxiniae]|uniref:Uncharacterized protein n=1 Tax=Dyadobacter chenwenxiniae TaxID=2906456 RepID=A0A9X1TIJ7_9BACT|nr:hypothetical protein [Dyadobacter chenwenxiniae]MCF0065589.1 hypothetical protein [Dyadobacter chenwenxiniae]UON85500.1 hypothetical protein MUK70_10935 [Dyadobacter chenwenxiniae]
MALHGYQFIREIDKFKLDSYNAHLGWISPYITTIKIYSCPKSTLFYLYDEVQDRLFEFSADDPKILKSAEEYNKVLHAYRMTYSP